MRNITVKSQWYGKNKLQEGGTFLPKVGEWGFPLDQQQCDDVTAVDIW